MAECEAVILNDLSNHTTTEIEDSDQIIRQLRVNITSLKGKVTEKQNCICILCIHQVLGTTGIFRNCYVCDVIFCVV
jgi:hypothetical protein